VSRHIAAEDAVPLFGLVDVVEMWDWGWGDIVGSLIGVDANISLVESVLSQYEASRVLRSYYRLKDIRAALESNPAMLAQFSPTLDRLRATDAQRRKVDRNSYRGEPQASGSVIAWDRADKQEIAIASAADVDPLSAAEAYPVDSGAPRCSVRDRPSVLRSVGDRFGWRRGAHSRNFNRIFPTMRVARRSCSSGAGPMALSARIAASAVRRR